MPRIKFSHVYTKMPNLLNSDGWENYLVGVSVVNLEDLPERFIAYDTEIFEYYPKKTPPSSFYPLPNKGKFMILTLFCKGGNNEKGRKVWTTIRRWTPRKEQYYRGLIGQEVEIKIMEAK